MFNNKRFQVDYTQNGFGASVEIFIDRETGVNYLFCQSGYAGGLTPLLDKDGNVVVTPIFKE